MIRAIRRRGYEMGVPVAQIGVTRKAKKNVIRDPEGNGGL